MGYFSMGYLMSLIFVADAEARTLFGLASAALSLWAFVPYVRDTMLDYTQPQRACWLIWSVLSCVALASQIHEGAGASLWFAGVQAGGTALVFVLSIAKGAGRFLKPGDGVVLALATLGLVLWAKTDSAVFALVISITVSLLGGVATVVKAYRDPGSETMATWRYGWLGAICASAAVGQVDWVLLAYPAYLFTLYGAIMTAMLLGQMQPNRIAT